VSGPGTRLPAGEVRRLAAGQAPGRRHAPWRAAFFALAIAGIIAGVAWALVGSRFLIVRSIQVSGTHLVPRSEVLSAAGIKDGLPLIRVNTAAVAHRIEQITQVESAQVRRAWPDSVAITVHERTPVLAVSSGSGYQLIDKFGVPVEQAAKRPPGMPRFTLAAGSPGVAALRGSPAVRAAATVLRELPAPLAGRVTRVSAPNASDVTLRLTGGITIAWGGTDRPAAKAKELRVLMRTHARSYDVSAPETAMTSG
jgi:cell division protein FtsQ